MKTETDPPSPDQIVLEKRVLHVGEHCQVQISQIVTRGDLLQQVLRLTAEPGMTLELLRAFIERVAELKEWNLKNRL
jgi:hypothetical protein